MPTPFASGIRNGCVARPNALFGETGDLVCTKPFPCMPVCFGADPDGAKYFDAYFSKYPGEPK